ncbi:MULTISPECIES: DUF934 domain-containing protein [unclassified Pseudomonas]|uniref:DUF934 domain-containing protein n=1 Tax=unclassified Pseudomonas TaxID=196821 RepID=UPI002AC93B4C|nr:MULTISPECIES: DUF934 domain-containing protein [unclassified Pseudomonas]MEB0048276.1 DUF934 domain-containing protein [Pseudomonas sp. Dout3]MEB0099229.1 DUF934 domain-containing protein [Pseudomonas sp. DC1.2]WPX61203.1 DUF934 domain-containing protein [Pseudomonas sp. DC1.2]
MNNLLRLEEGVARIVVDDPWTLVRDFDAPLPSGPLMVPLAGWLIRRIDYNPVRDAVWLGPDDEVESLKPWLRLLPLIALDFPSFRDGRAYSQAYLLRTRLGWQGELRAVGDVLRDQLSHMRQCGFDSFAVREDKSVEDALKGLAGMSVTYGRSAIEPRPLFRRR